MIPLVWGCGGILFGFALSHLIARGVVELLLEEITALEKERKALNEAATRYHSR